MIFDCFCCQSLLLYEIVNANDVEVRNACFLSEETREKEPDNKPGKPGDTVAHTEGAGDRCKDWLEQCRLSVRKAAVPTSE